MATYTVAPLGKEIDFSPPSVVEEVLQNVATILATMRFSVPYDRGLGLNPEYLDDPMPVSQARATADIIEAIHRYEPRCRVESVTFKGDGVDGTLIPTVRIYING